MKLVLLGVSGAGKGTQAKNLSKHFGIAHISTGDILRDHMKRETKIGLNIRHIMDTGNLVDDDMMIEIVKDKLKQPECENGYILDGFPRTLPQVISLDSFQDINRAVYVKVDDGVVIERLTGRRICTNCAEMYHVNYLPPFVEGICDKCGTSLIQREDDKAETVLGRLHVFHYLTEPIIEYYKDKDLLLTVSGEGDVKQITDTIIEQLSNS